MTALRIGLLGCLVWGLVNGTPAAEPTARLTADIAPQPVSEALEAFTRQTGLQLIYVSSVADTLQSKGVRAGVSAPAALEQLLEGTGLTFEFLNARTVKIFPGPTIVPTLTATSATQHTDHRGRFGATGLDEVVVTGIRGQERLSKVPMEIKVWTEEAMELSDVKGMAQLGALTPGVGFAASPGIGGDAYTHLNIRGVTNRFGATVGVYLGDTPIPPIRVASYLASFPLTFDLDRVEILAGPQAVLLGDHTQAGAVRFIPTQPSLTTATGLFRAQWGTTEYGGPSYEAGAAVGGPIVKDVLGFRLTGWYREDGGYVDRVDPAATSVTLDANANRYFSKLIRGALTFAPNSSVQVTPALTYQSIRTRDTSTFDITLSHPGRGVFKNPSPVPQPFEDTYYLASVKVTAGMRASDLSAVASYFDQMVNAVLYFSPPDTDYYALRQRAYSADVRLSSHDPDAALTWVTGIFAADERAHHPHWYGGAYIDTPATDQTRLEAFGQIAGRITQHLTANIGVRVGHSNNHYSDDAPPPIDGETSHSWYAPRLGLSWQADEEDLLYLTVAKGYGSPVFYPSAELIQSPADTLWSYEIGSKHELLDGRLHLEANAFHIEWNNGPPNPKFLYLEHKPIPGRAVSNGLGLTIQALVTQQTKVAVAVAYTDAHVTQTSTLDNLLYVRAGTSLAVSPWNVTASIEQAVPLRSDFMASLRVEDAFRSAPRYDNAPGSPVYGSGPSDPATNVLNARAAIKWSSFEVAALLRNALNSHPVLSGYANGADNGGADTQFFTLVPRTLSVSGTWRF
jgi:iron complex outermembrane receptor protein